MRLPRPYILRGRGGKEVNQRKKNKRMGSSRGKTLLRMTSAALDEILTDSKDESSG
jgi:truncated hemoglobin YjbI